MSGRGIIPFSIGILGINMLAEHYLPYPSEVKARQEASRKPVLFSVPVGSNGAVGNHATEPAAPAKPLDNHRRSAP